MGHLVFVETSGSGVRAIELAKQAGHVVTYLWSPRYDFTAAPGQRARAHELADRTARLPGRPGRDALTAAVRDAGTGPGEVDAVLSTLAFGAPLAADLAAALGVRGTPAAAVTRARDKARCRTILRDAGVPSLRFAVVRSASEAIQAAEAIGYPVIIKPVLGVAKAATTIAHTPGQVLGHFAGLADDMRNMAAGMAAHFDDRHLVEELAVGDLYSVEVAADGASFVPLASAVRKTGRDNPVFEMGCTFPSGLGPADEAELGAYAARVCRTLGLNVGIFHVEVMRTADGFRLIEANPRMAGGAIPDTINAAADRDLFGVLLDLYLGLPAPSGPLRHTAVSSHSLLGAAAAATAPPDLPAGWFEPFRAQMHSGWVRYVEPGRPIPPMRGNFDTFGMVRAVAGDAAAAERRCTRLREEIGRYLDVPLVPERAPSVPLTGLDRA